MVLVIEVKKSELIQNSKNNTAHTHLRSLSVLFLEIDHENISLFFLSLYIFSVLCNTEK